MHAYTLYGIGSYWHDMPRTQKATLKNAEISNSS